MTSRRTARQKHGRAATVRCVVRTACPTGSADLVTFPSGLRVTPWHPVRTPGEASWSFPARLAAAERWGPEQGPTPCEAVFSVLLDGGRALLLDGCEGVALGHGIADDPVASHPFFGDESAVLSSLRAMAGWRDGFIDLDPKRPVERDAFWCEATRSGRGSGLVCGLREGRSC